MEAIVNNKSIARFSRPVSLLSHAVIVLGLIVGAGTNTTLAQEKATGTKETAGQQKTASDHRFATEAASGGVAEVKLGQLAQQKASSEKVKEFGQKMVTDHGKAGDELKDVAKQQGLKLPEHMSKEDQATYDRLSKLEGKQFDEAYTRAMLTDHQKDVAAFEREASSGNNEALKEFASRTLPTLKEHLKMARDMSKGSTRAS
jgi:putative membrane protein